MVTPPLLKVRMPLPPSAPLPPLALTVPPFMVRLPLWMPSPLSLPLLPPVALTVPPEMVTPPLLKMPLPPLPPVRELSPFRVSVTSPFEVRAEPESEPTLMFTSLSVTSTLSFLSLVSMVTVLEEAMSLF